MEELKKHCEPKHNCKAFEQMESELSELRQRNENLPDTCDGKEQEAFEEFARAAYMDMSQHPLHYLFLNSETNAARQAWKAAILYCRDQVEPPKEKDHE